MPKRARIIGTASRRYNRMQLARNPNAKNAAHNAVLMKNQSSLTTQPTDNNPIPIVIEADDHELAEED